MTTAQASSCTRILSKPLNCLALFTLIFGLMACEGKPIVTDGEGSGGTGDIPCSSVNDCPDPTAYECVSVCKLKCTQDTDCSADAFCTDTGFCEVGCRDSSTCPSGEYCVSGVCQSGNSECSSKCDCEEGLVCQNNVCQDPPSQCQNSADCGRGPGENCEAFICNGFTNQCIEQSPEPCTTNADCTGRPGCDGGCGCNSEGQCIPLGECTPETQETDCAEGEICNDNMECVPAPSCLNGGIQCAAGEVCNPETGICEPAVNCTSNADCGPNEICNTATGQCEPTSGGTGGVAGWGEACASALGGGGGATCADGLTCGLLTSVCEELCDTPGACTSCCPISGGNFCEQGMLVNFCRIQ